MYIYIHIYITQKAARQDELCGWNKFRVDSLDELAAELIAGNDCKMFKTPKEAARLGDQKHYIRMQVLQICKEETSISSTGGASPQSISVCICINVGI